MTATRLLFGSRWGQAAPEDRSDQRVAVDTREHDMEQQSLNATAAFDRAGMSASLACAVHCALLPLALAALPALGLVWLDSPWAGLVHGGARAGDRPASRIAAAIVCT